MCVYITILLQFYITIHSMFRFTLKELRYDIILFPYRVTNTRNIESLRPAYPTCGIT
jgi:hypothetical protein